VVAASRVAAPAMSATPATLAAMCWEPAATSATLRLISPVVADCSSTAAAIVSCSSAIWPALVHYD